MLSYMFFRLLPNTNVKARRVAEKVEKPCKDRGGWVEEEDNGHVLTRPPPHTHVPPHTPRRSLPHTHLEQVDLPDKQVDGKEEEVDAHAQAELQAVNDGVGILQAGRGG